jgi:uncharacterized cupin superfamily protein
MGVCRVSVRETKLSFGEGSGVAHFLQNWESEVFSVLHFGHFMVTAVPFYQVWVKLIKE